MHRVIMKAPVGQLVDHTNHNQLDNRKSNLRFATRSQNMMNRFKNSTSLYKGLLYDKKKKLYRVIIKANGICYRLGRYKDPHIAALVYDLWSKELHGEFAKTNFPVVAHSSQISTENVELTNQFNPYETN